MVEKRLFKKMPLLKQEINAPVLYGEESPEVVIVGWGSTYGVLKEAVDVLSKDRTIAMVHFSEVYPFPSSRDYLSVLHKAKQTICIEHNATGQFRRLLQAESGYSCSAFINRYDGRPFLLEELIGEIRAIIE